MIFAIYFFFIKGTYINLEFHSALITHAIKESPTMTSLEDGASPIISAKTWALICRFESQAVTNTFLLCHMLINSLDLKC